MPGSNEEMQVYSPGCAACPHGAATATALLRAASAPASHSLLEVVAAVRPGAGSNACSVHQCGMRSRRTATADGGLGGGGGGGGAVRGMHAWTAVANTGGSHRSGMHAG